MDSSALLSRRVVLAAMALGLCSTLLFAREDPKKAELAAPEAATGKPGNLSDPADLEAFFDGVLGVQLESRHIAGAVVAVVVGDRVVFRKGYGYADIDARQKVDPDKTLFRIASITKLFTWTAVMQQYEEGKLDLDADINKYLKDVQVPATFAEPITLKHLMSHTPGFDDWVIGVFAHKAEDLPPLAQMLRQQMPSRVRPPGELPSYSNQGTAMAGLAVAGVSGLSWEDYVEQRILQPLGMEHTLVRQPPTDKLPAELSRGYRWRGGRFEAQGFEYISGEPAGCISATASDMAQLMRAHLNDGRLGMARILKPDTARLMHSPLSRPDPRTSAMCYGFWEQECNGQRIIGHGGDTLWFHSLLQMFPDRGVGLFVSYNTDTSAGEREVLFSAFMRRYFPSTDPPRVQASGDFARNAKRVAGEYASTRYSHTSATKLIALMGGLRVSANDDDTVTLSTLRGGRRYTEIEPLVFRELDGHRKIVFHEDKNGNIAYLVPADAPAFAAVRRPWYELAAVQVGLLIGCAVTFASAVLFWPALAFTARGGSWPNIKRNRRSAWLSCLAWLYSLVALGLIAVGVIVADDPNEIIFGLTPALKMLLAGTQVCALLAALVVVGCLIAWKNRYWRLTGRVHYTLVALAGVGFVVWLYHWNLLTFGFRGL
jgi:CubicO group peptidase (beta-lactamase class C family)